MRVTAIAVSTLDGKITRGRDSNIYSWTSKGDQEFFRNQIEDNNLIVMGRKTYEAAKNRIVLKKGKLRVVLTRNPKKYGRYGVKGKLEFTNESPVKLVKRLEREGFDKMLLVGGDSNGLFFQHGLVNDLYLTLEPLVFGNGKTFAAKKLLDTALKLVSVRKLNLKGTLVLHYEVIG